jgi:hypothetical protein
LGNNNEKLGLPERLSTGIQFRFRNLFHGKKIKVEGEGKILTAYKISSFGVAVVVVWKLDLQLPVQSVPITTKVVSSNNVPDLPGLGNNNEKLGLPERLSTGIQFRFRNLFHGKKIG